MEEAKKSRFEAKGFIEHFEETSGYLNLHNISLTDNKIQEMMKYDWSEVQSMDLSKNSITDEGIQSLAQGMCWKKLQSLFLANNKITGNGAHFITKQAFPVLEILSLAHNQITEFLPKGHPENLKSLWLSSNKLDLSVVDTLSNGKWNNLVSIHLCGIILGDTGIIKMTGAPWNKLRKLNLTQCLISDDGCFELSKKSWNDLEELYLAADKISSKGIVFLMENTWPSLEIFHAHDNRIDDEGLVAITNHPWPKLKQISLERNLESSEEVKQELRAKFFNSHVTLTL